MLSDRFFIPLFTIVIAGIVYVALAYGPRPDGGENPLDGDPLAGFVIEDNSLHLLRSGPGLTLEFLTTETDGLLARTAAGQAPDQGTRSAGTFLSFLPDIGEAWEGHTITASVHLRKPAESGSDDVFIKFYSLNNQNGEAVPCPVSTEWQICTMTHAVQPSDQPPNMQFIGIWPDTKGLSRMIEIKRIEITVDHEPLAAGAQ